MSLITRIENGMVAAHGISQYRVDAPAPAPATEWDTFADANLSEALKLHDAYFRDNGLEVGDALIAWLHNPGDRWAVSTLKANAHNLAEARESRLLHIGPTPPRRVRCQRCGEMTKID